MTERLFSMPHHEELDATVIIKRGSTPEPSDTVGIANDYAGDGSDELLADDSLDNTFFETQDVSEWLEDSLFSVQRGEQASTSEAVGDTAPLTSENSTMSVPSDLFSDFESGAPEPPRPHQVAAKREPAVAPKAPEPREKSKPETPWQWANTLGYSNKLPLVGVSLMVLLAMGSLVAFNTTQLETEEKGVEPPTLSLLKNVPNSEVEPQWKQAAQSSEERYCLSQGIRLGAAVERAATLTGSAAEILQSLFRDFSQRCENYQFVPEVYLQTQLTASVLSLNLEKESSVLGEVIQPATAAMVDSTVSKPAISAPSRSVVSPQVIKNIQWRLVKLGFYKVRADGKGRIDGVYNADTQVAVNAFYQKHNEFVKPESEIEIFRVIDSVYAKQK